MARKITVIRFEVYPNPELAESIAIRLLLESNGRMDTAEIVVPIADCIDPTTGETFTAEQIIEIAFTIVTLQAVEAKEEIQAVEATETTEAIPYQEAIEAIEQRIFRQDVIDRFEAMESKPAIIGMEINMAE